MYLICQTYYLNEIVGSPSDFHCLLNITYIRLDGVQELHEPIVGTFIKFSLNTAKVQYIATK